MGRVKAYKTEIQKDSALFPRLQAEIRKFGFQEVASAAGLNSYQTVGKYFHGVPVNIQSEKKILEGLKKLLLGETPHKNVLNDIINLSQKEEVAA